MTIPKLRQKAIETGKGFSEIVFPPRNCNELPAKLADKHQLQTTQKSQVYTLKIIIYLNDVVQGLKFMQEIENFSTDTNLCIHYVVDMTLRF